MRDTVSRERFRRAFRFLGRQDWLAPWPATRSCPQGAKGGRGGGIRTHDLQLPKPARPSRVRERGRRAVALQADEYGRRMVGVVRFELTTYSSQSCRATRLRYAPMMV